MISKANRHKHVKRGAELSEIYWSMTQQQRAEPCNCGAHPKGEIIPLANGELREVDPLASECSMGMCACCAKRIYWRKVQVA